MEDGQRWWLLRAEIYIMLRLICNVLRTPMTYLMLLYFMCLVMLYVVPVVSVSAVLYVF
jgi:hypothetical protein